MTETIAVPIAAWVLGDREHATCSGVTTVTRPLYYRPSSDHAIRIGQIDSDYAEPLMDALSSRVTSGRERSTE